MSSVGSCLPPPPANIAGCGSAPALLFCTRPKGPCPQLWWCNKEKKELWSQDAQSRAALSSINTIKATSVVLGSLVTTLKKVKWIVILILIVYFIYPNGSQLGEILHPGGIWQCLAKSLGKFWLSQLGVCWWHLMGRSQRCSWTSYNAQGTASHSKKPYSPKCLCYWGWKIQI